eukprot:1478368-Amphidinium_carterae.1
MACLDNNGVTSADLGIKRYTKSFRSPYAGILTAIQGSPRCEQCITSAGRFVHAVFQTARLRVLLGRHVITTAICLSQQWLLGGNCF